MSKKRSLRLKKKTNDGAMDGVIRMIDTVVENKIRPLTEQLEKAQEDVRVLFLILDDVYSCVKLAASSQGSAKAILSDLLDNLQTALLHLDDVPEVREWRRVFMDDSETETTFSFTEEYFSDSEISMEGYEDDELVEDVSEEVERRPRRRNR